MYITEYVKDDELKIYDHDNKYSVSCKIIKEEDSICWNCINYVNEAHFCVVNQTYYSFIDYWFNEEINNCDNYSDHFI
mgnify:FL=1